MGARPAIPNLLDPTRYCAKHATPYHEPDWNSEPVLSASFLDWAPLNWVPSLVYVNLFSFAIIIQYFLQVLALFGYWTTEQEDILKSLEHLFLLGALSDDYKLSNPVGHQMARLPLDPIYAKSLILASEFNCLEEMLITVAMLSVESIFHTPREKLEEARDARKCFSSPEGDHLTLINVFRSSAEFLRKRKVSGSKDKTAEKSLSKWCKENFINSRSLKHAQDIHSQIKGHVDIWVCVLLHVEMKCFSSEDALLLPSF